MAGTDLGVSITGAKAKGVMRTVAGWLPEWQIFIRHRDGRSERFVLTRRRQMILLGSVAVISLWASAASMLLSKQPEELAAKERRLEEMMASYRSAQHRLDASQKMVSEITREIDAVHANLLVLAESNATLAKDRAPAAMRPAIAVAKIHVGAEPAYDDDSQPGGSESKAVRDHVRKLESSLDRLRVTYARVVQNTADLANSRIVEAERSLAKLGLDPDRLINAQLKIKGRGGPFIPAAPSSGSDANLGNLVERMDRWDGVKATMQKMPLSEPVHQDWDLNSHFGTRNDPLNNRTGVHEGIDLGAPYGTPIYATGEGVVRLAGPYDRYGLTVDVDHGDGITTRFAHMSRVKVKVGQRVNRNTVVGLLGNTGRSTGAHLHYEVRVSDTPRDPLKFISAGRDVPKIR